MALAFSPDLVKRSLEKDGFFNLQDPAVGERILDMELRRFPFAAAYGLDFCRHVLFHPRIRPVLEAHFPKCTLGHSMRYTKKPGHVFRFMAGGPSSDLALMVHLCAKESQITYYAGSHKHSLYHPIDKKSESNEPSEPLLEDSHSALVNAGCLPVECAFKIGSLIIADARLAFELKEGYMIVDVFFPDNLLPPKKMMLPRYSTELADKINEMQSERIRVNFGFKTPAKDADVAS